MQVTATIKGWPEKNGLWNWTIGASVSEISIDVQLSGSQKTQIDQRVMEILEELRDCIMRNHEKFRKEEFDELYGGKK